MRSTRTLGLKAFGNWWPPSFHFLLILHAFFLFFSFLLFFFCQGWSWTPVSSTKLHFSLQSALSKRFHGFDASAVCLNLRDVPGRNGHFPSTKFENNNFAETRFHRPWWYHCVRMLPWCLPPAGVGYLCPHCLRGGTRVHAL